MNANRLWPILARGVAAFALAAGLCLPAVSLAAAFDIDQLMQSLAAAKSGRVTFVEKKYLAMFERPIESSGELLYTAPARLEKRTIKPKAESLIVDGNVLVIERGRKKHTLQLQDYPELASFIDSVRGTLAGDRKALERSYKLRLAGSMDRWTLDLLPTDVNMGAMINLIRIEGVRDFVRSVDVVQADGDHSLMTIERAATQ